MTALLTPLSPFIRDEFALDYTQIGWVLSAFMLTYGVSQLPAGWLSDRFGSRILLTVGVAGVALFGLLVGLAPTYVTMVVALILMGVMGGGYHPASAPLVSASVESKNRGRALGLHQIGGSASNFLTPLIAVAIATAVSWRGSFIAISIPGIIFGIVFYVLLGRRGYTEKAKHAASGGPVDTSPDKIHLRRLVPFLFLSIAVPVLIFSVISFIPLFTVDSFGISEDKAAILLSLVFAAGFWAGPLGGHLSDRLGGVLVILVASLVVGPVVYLLNLTSYNWSIFVVLLAIGTLMYTTMPVSEAYIISQTPQRNRSTVLGIYYFGSRGGMGVMAPIMGSLIDRFGFNTSFTIIAAALLIVALACAAFLWGSRDRPSRQ